MCPKVSDPFHIVFLLYKTGHYFLDTQYHLYKCQEYQNTDFGYGLVATYFFLPIQLIFLVS